MFSEWIPGLEHPLLGAAGIKKWKPNEGFYLHLTKNCLPHVVMWCSRKFKNFEWNKEWHKQILKEPDIRTQDLFTTEENFRFAGEYNRLDIIFGHYPDAIILEEANPNPNEHFWEYCLRFKQWGLANYNLTMNWKN